MKIFFTKNDFKRNAVWTDQDEKRASENDQPKQSNEPSVVQGIPRRWRENQVNSVKSFVHDTNVLVHVVV